MSNLSLDRFELPFLNPFRKKGESMTRLRARCDRSTKEFKLRYELMYGSGITASQTKSYYERHAKSGRVYVKGVE